MGTTANIRDVNVSWGDGSSQSIGALGGSTTVAHTYTTDGTFTVRATATDSSGFTESVSTSITVLPAQPPNIVVTPSNANPIVGETVILRATVSGNTSTIVSFQWNFGNDATPASFTGSSSQVPVTWSSPGTKVINVRAIQATGPSGDGFGTVTVGTPR